MLCVGCCLTQQVGGVVALMSLLRVLQASVVDRFRGSTNTFEQNDGHDPPEEAACPVWCLALLSSLLCAAFCRLNHFLVCFLVLAAPANCSTSFCAGLSQLLPEPSIKTSWLAFPSTSFRRMCFLAGCICRTALDRPVGNFGGEITVSSTKEVRVSNVLISAGAGGK